MIHVDAAAQAQKEIAQEAVLSAVRSRLVYAIGLLEQSADVGYPAERESINQARKLVLDALLALTEL